MVTRPVSSMDTNATGLNLGASATGAGLGLLAKPRGSRRRPITNPPATAAPPTRKLRRLMFSSTAGISGLLGGGLDGRANPLIRSAAADVARHGVVDLLIGRLRRRGE